MPVPVRLPTGDGTARGDEQPQEQHDGEDGNDDRSSHESPLVECGGLPPADGEPGVYERRDATAGKKA